FIKNITPPQPSVCW
ncbi:Sulfurtransferase TusE, partial [Haemophilus influenzae]